MKHVFVIGVGLIGGSFALDIKAILPQVKIYGIGIHVLNKTKTSSF